jgi:hypothetical protein
VHTSQRKSSGSGSVGLVIRCSAAVRLLILHPTAPAAAQAQSVPESATSVPLQSPTPPYSPVEPNDKPFARLLPDLFNDLRDIASLDNVIVLGRGGP